MSSWRSSNIDEMVLAAFVKKGPLLPKEEVHWRVLSVVGFSIVHGALSSARNAPCTEAVVRVAADHDGIVPRHPCGGAVVRVVADHDGTVPGRPGGGAVVGVAADDDGAVPGRSGGGTTVADVVLDIADDGALEDPVER